MTTPVTPSLAAGGTAHQLLAAGLISRPEHLAEVTHLQLGADFGHAPAVWVRVYQGLTVEILPDRGLDIGRVWYRDKPMAWSSPITDRSRLTPATNQDWISRFNGGLLVTCGLDNVGPARDGLGMHGSYSQLPARHLQWDRQITAAGVTVTVTATIDNMAVFGQRLRVERTITITAPYDAAPAIRVDDVIHNDGVAPAPVSLLYHINFGAPAIVPGTRAQVAADQVTPREIVPEVPEAHTLPQPCDVITEGVFEYEGVVVEQGVSQASLRLPDATVDHIVVRWSADSLPRLYQWIYPTRGGWALGIEPANAPMYGPDRQRPDAGVPQLPPGESWRSFAEITIRDVTV